MQRGRVVPTHTMVELAELADAARAAHDRLCDDVIGEVFAAVPQLADDVEVRALVLGAVPALLSALEDAIAAPSVDAGPPPEAVALVAPLVRRGAEPVHLMRACRIAQATLSRGLAGAPAEAVELAAARVAARTDVVVDALMRAWLEQREHRVARRLARRSALVHGLVAGEDADVGVASAALGWDLGRWISAVVLWDERPDERHDPLQALEDLAAALAAAVDGTDAFVVPADDGGLWAWLAAAAPPDLDTLAHAADAAAREGQRVAFGTPAEGLVGFRVGHTEALLARRIAALSGRPTAVVRYDEVEAVSLMADDPERLARFVRRTLGALAADNEPTARLRRTLRVWLSTGGSAPAAAARLGVHKNTVLYRVHRAGVLLPRPVEADRLALELALAAADEVGLERLTLS
jgi:sugar diacid utilization regulator